MITRSILTLALATVVACGGDDALPPERLPAEGLPFTMEGLLIQNVPGCREDGDCVSGICRFGSCLALARLEAPWQVPIVMARVKQVIAQHPESAELRRRAVARLELLLDEGSALAFRARALEGLEALGEVDAIRRRFDTLPMALQELAAVALSRLGDTTGQDLTIALTESEQLPIAIEATRALAHSKDPLALSIVLGLLSPELEPELQRAAVDTLGAMGDTRAIRPLVAYLAEGPDALADRVAASLRLLAKPEQPLPPDADAWTRWLSTHAVPEPPPYTLRKAKGSEEDLDLPTP